MYSVLTLCVPPAHILCTPLRRSPCIPIAPNVLGMDSACEFDRVSRCTVCTLYVLSMCLNNAQAQQFGFWSLVNCIKFLQFYYVLIFSLLFNIVDLFIFDLITRYNQKSIVIVFVFILETSFIPITIRIGLTMHWMYC